MTRLMVDALIALTKTFDRGLSAIESVRLRAHSPGPVVDAQPAGAGDSPVSAAGTGGHPDDDDYEPEPTSDLLTFAAEEIRSLGLMAFARPQPWIEGFAAELRERAKELALQGD